MVAGVRMGFLSKAERGPAEGVRHILFSVHAPTDTWVPSLALMDNAMWTWGGVRVFSRPCSRLLGCDASPGPHGSSIFRVF